jgi:hypothetical protein
MVIADFAYQDGCRGGNLLFRPTAAAPPANAVMSAFPARGLTVQDGIARNRAVNTAFPFLLPGDAVS